MFNSEQEKTTYARLLTHYLYRNQDIIENNHARSITMDMNYYKQVKSILARRLKVVIKNKKYLETFLDKKVKNQEDILRAVAKIPKEDVESFLKFLSEINAFFGKNWDEPYPLEFNRLNETVDEYILGGEFLHCCETNAVLDDKTMCKINKDINNRIYTLIKNGLL